MEKKFRGKLEYRKSLFQSGPSRVVILPIVFLNYLDIQKKVKVIINPVDKSIVIKKDDASGENQE